MKDSGIRPLLKVVRRKGEGLRNILSVEDNQADVHLLRVLFKRHISEPALHFVGDGEEALDFINKRGIYSEVQRPDLVLLDLNLPKIDGFGVLEELKNHEEFKAIPVVVLTTSSRPEDIELSYRLHAASYIIKPSSVGAFDQIIRVLRSYWCELVEFSPKEFNLCSSVDYGKGV